jgi:hypothetical protein
MPMVHFGSFFPLDILTVPDDCGKIASLTLVERGPFDHARLIL